MTGPARFRQLAVAAAIAALAPLPSGAVSAQCLDNDGAVRSITDTWDMIDNLGDACVLTVSQATCAPSPSPSVTVSGTCTVASALSLSGSIDVSTAPATLTLTGTTSVAFCSSVVVSATSSDFSTFTGSGSCNDTIPLTFTMTRRCGNGTVDPGEDCQEAAAAHPSGPCCSTSTCRLKPATAQCVPDSFGQCLFDLGACSGDSSQGCVAAPPCSTGASKSKVILTNRSAPGRNSLKWHWKSTAAVDVSDFSPALDPSKVIDVCATDATGAIRSVHEVTGGPGWTPTGSSGFRYRDKNLLQDGIRTITLKAGPAGKAKIIVKGRGANLGAPTLPLSAPAHVYLLLRSATTSEAQFDACWDATYSSAAVNSASAFKAKLP